MILGAFLAMRESTSTNKWIFSSFSFSFEQLLCAYSISSFWKWLIILVKCILPKKKLKGFTILTNFKCIFLWHSLHSFNVFNPGFFSNIVSPATYMQDSSICLWYITTSLAAWERMDATALFAVVWSPSVAYVPLLSTKELHFLIELGFTWVYSLEEISF